MRLLHELCGCSFGWLAGSFIFFLTGFAILLSNIIQSGVEIYLCRHPVRILSSGVGKPGESDVEGI